MHKVICGLATLALLSGMAQAEVVAIAKENRCVWPGGPVLDGPTGENFFGGAVVSWFLAAKTPKDVATLAGLLDKYIKDKCVFVDGRPFQGIMLKSYQKAFKDTANWDGARERIEALKTANPDAIYLSALEVQWWIDAGWSARGTGYASSVTRDGMRLFQERLLRAESLLIETKPRAAELPYWYQQMLVVQSALGGSGSDRDNIFVEGASRFKTYYPLYFTMLNFLSPRWGGSWGAIDSLVAWSVKNTQATEGNALYARMYWNIGETMREGEQLFKSTKAQWPKMKAGFEDLMMKNPDSLWNLNNYAEFSCEAGDGATFRMLRKKMDKQVVAEAWNRGYPLDVCEAKFRGTRS